MSALDQMPNGRDAEQAAAVLQSEAMKLAVWVPDDPTEAQGSEHAGGRWEAPNGGPPAPGAAESAVGLLKVAMALEAISGPLGEFSDALSNGGSPMDFLMSMMAEGSDQQPQLEG